MSRAAKCLEQLEKSGIKVSRIQHNLPPASLIEVAIRRREGMLSDTGALTVNTGKYTGRSPDDRFIVDDEVTHNTVDWGKVNHSLSQDKYELIFNRLKNHLDKKEYFVFDGFVGADTKGKTADKGSYRQSMAMPFCDPNIRKTCYKMSLKLCNLNLVWFR